MTNAPCPLTIPTYYTLTLHTIAGLSVTINLLGFYLVWFQSPKMQGYKYCLCYLQFVSFITEIHMSWLCPGFYFFPMIGGYNTGAELMNSHYSMTLLVFVFAFELPSALLCFVFRHNAAETMRHNGSGKMYVEKFFLLLCHLFPFAASFSMWMSRLTEQQKYDLVRNKWSQCLYWAQFDVFEVYDYKMNPWLAVVGIGALLFVFIVYTYGLGLAIHTMSILQALRKSMSKQTYQMHKTALFSLVMQIMLPGVLILGPLFICLAVVITEAIELQELATDTMFLVTSHSMCSCFVMILCNSRCRTVVREKILKVFRFLRLKKCVINQEQTTIETRQRINSIGVRKNVSS